MANDNMNNTPKKPAGKGGGNQLLITVIIIIAIAWIAFWFTSQKTEERAQFTYSQFMEKVTDKKITNMSVKIVEKDILGEYTDEGISTKFKTYIPYSTDRLVSTLLENNVKVEGEPKEMEWLPIILVNVLPILLFAFIIWFFMFRQVQGSNNKAMNFGKNKSREVRKEDVNITFKDVEGCKESKEELEEVVEFLKNPKKFLNLGAKIPKGVLLVGPPGTGKTLLAKAVAGEAGVKFLNMSGSEFVEMFVGVGASRVRSLFEEGKKSAPCLIFIDELDAVGRTRGAGYGGGHDEREQTLNQMLVEMDGFGTDTNVIIIAATNRPDVLDPALLRPGRFDRQVIVDKPDIKGREGILRVHAAKIKLSEKTDLMVIARATPGFSGADLANLINEAAILAARRNKQEVEMADLEEAKDKVMMGPERRSITISERELVNTAYHEVGHALVSLFLKETDNIHKLTIIPRGRTLGSTWSLPTDGRYTLSAEKILDQIAMLLAGRIAEEYKFGRQSVTNGASNDIERATEFARKMICEWGMSELGPISFGQKEQPIFLGKEIARHKDYSEDTARKIDEEVVKILESQFHRAKKIIEDNSEALEKLAQALIEYETLDLDDMEDILGMDLKKGDEKLVSLSEPKARLRDTRGKAKELMKENEGKHSEEPEKTAYSDEANEAEAEKEEEKSNNSEEDDGKE